jgi:hypothetical protein
MRRKVDDSVRSRCADTDRRGRPFQNDSRQYDPFGATRTRTGVDQPKKGDEVLKDLNAQGEAVTRISRVMSLES